MNRPELQALLLAKGQNPWASDVRTSGLLSLLGYFCHMKPQNGKKQAEGVPCSNRLARCYSSQLRDPPKGVHGVPLAVLLAIGVLERVRPAKVNFHTKESARYRLAPAYHGRKIAGTDEKTNPCVRGKLEHAPARLEKGLNRRFRFRAQLLLDLRALTIPSAANAERDKLLGDPNNRHSAMRSIKAIATGEHTVTVKGSGLIVTSLVSCPRPLKPLLHLAGEPVALCDISCAHFMFWPRLVSDRIEYCLQRGDTEESLVPLLAEFHRLIQFYSDERRFYERLCPPNAPKEMVKQKKIVLNMLMNSPPWRAKNHGAWAGLKRMFPRCCRIIDAIKKDDHRKMSAQFQHFTANAITAALLELQALGIPAVPDNDCLIVRKRDHGAACLAIGKAMFAETRGVRVTVGGVRFAGV